MDDLMREFLTESAENLSALDRAVVELEHSPGSKDTLAQIFRTIHTVKGTCGFLGLSRLERLAHSAENVLGRMRDGHLAVTPEAVSRILRAVDVIKEILAGLEATEAEPPGDDSEVIRALDELTMPGGNGAEVGATPGQGGCETVQEQARVRVEPDAAVPLPGGPVSAELAEGAVGGQGEGKGPVAAQTLRVSVDILDQLMNMVGELVLTRNQLLQLTKTEEDPKYAEPVQHMNRVTSGLQEAVMRTRMQPIGNAWGKLPRLVRDLCQLSGKQIELVMHGTETELDRQILQSIQDPMVHLVRNSADHGIEPPDVRRAAGKSPTGTITLNAYHEGGHIIIEIADDGAGINVARVRAKAIERGLVTAEAAATMPDARILEFIFEAGFSTAAEVTSVSGRGVGMDVVRTNIEKIGGVVDINSREGQGTTVRVKIPLTLAIISALIVGHGGQPFAIPQIGIVELVRVSEDTRHLVGEVHGAPVFRLRDRLLPLVRLDAVLGLPRSGQSGDLIIVVAQVGESRFGLVVDEVFDTQEIVVKPIGRLVKDIALFAGTTILGDGRVIMILDTAAISARAHALSGGSETRAAAAVEASDFGGGGERTSLLLFKGGSEAPQAVPLSLVTRLEEFPVAKIERAAGRYLVQYRGALLPLVPAVESMEMAAVDPRPVIVFSDGRRAMGLMVDRILDIVESVVRIEATGGRPGVLGAAIVSGQATEVIDTYFYLRLAYGDWFTGTDGSDGPVRRSRVLFVEDSAFFRELLGPVIQAAGFDVVTSADGRHAVKRFERGERFDLVLSDIEMPGVDGFELAARLKAHPEWRAVPLLALTGRDTPGQRERVLAAGYAEYLVKLDRDAVLAAMQRVTTAARGVAS